MDGLRDFVAHRSMQSPGSPSIPGEMELRNRERSMQEGVRLRRSTYDALVSYGCKAGLQAQIALAAHNDGVAGRAYAE
jgi:hypothetical protein